MTTLVALASTSAPGARTRTAVRCSAKKRSSITPKIISEGGRATSQSTTQDDVPTPLSADKQRSLPPEMLVDDPWESESFEGLGIAAQYALLVIGIVAAGAGFYATSTYNEGAVEVDFQSYASPEEAVADSLRKVNALQAQNASSPNVEMK
jgi:hypothetical protein